MRKLIVFLMFLFFVANSFAVYEEPRVFFDFEYFGVNGVNNNPGYSGGDEVYQTDSMIREYSRYFDGSGDVLDSRFSPPGGSYTIAGWVKTASARTHTIASQYDDGYFRGWYLRVESNNLVSLTHGEGSSWDTVTSTTTVPLSTWTFVGAVYDADTSEISIYVNGVKEQTRSVTGYVDNSINMYIGRMSEGTGYDFHGNVDALAYWDVALSEKEMLVLNNTGGNSMNTVFFEEGVDYNLTINPSVDNIATNKNLVIKPTNDMKQGSHLKIDFDRFGIDDTQNYLVPVFIRSPFFEHTYCKFEYFDETEFSLPNCLNIGNFTSDSYYIELELPEDVKGGKTYNYEIVFGYPNDIGKLAQKISTNQFIDSVTFKPTLDFTDYYIYNSDSYTIERRQKTQMGQFDSQYSWGGETYLQGYYDVQEYIYAEAERESCNCNVGADVSFQQGGIDRYSFGTVFRKMDNERDSCWIHWQDIDVNTPAPFPEYNGCGGDCAGTSTCGSNGLPVNTYNWYGELSGNLGAWKGKEGTHASAGGTSRYKMYTTDYDLVVDKSIDSHFKGHNFNLSPVNRYWQRYSLVSQDSNYYYFNYSKDSYDAIAINLAMSIDKETTFNVDDNPLSTLEFISFTDGTIPNFDSDLIGNALSITNDFSEDGVVAYFMRTSNGERLNINGDIYYVVDRRLFDSDGFEIFPNWKTHHYLTEEFTVINNHILFRNGVLAYPNQEFFIIPAGAHISGQKQYMDQRTFFKSTSRAPTELTTDYEVTYAPSSSFGNKVAWHTDISIKANKRDLGVGEKIYLPLDSKFSNQTNLVPVALRNLGDDEIICLNGHISNGALNKKSCLDSYKVWDEEFGYIVVKVPENINMQETKSYQITWGLPSTTSGLIGGEDILHLMDMYTNYPWISDYEHNYKGSLSDGYFKLVSRYSGKIDYVQNNLVKNQNLGFIDFISNHKLEYTIDRNVGYCKYGGGGSSLWYDNFPDNFYISATTTPYTNISEAIQFEGVFGQIRGNRWPDHEGCYAQSYTSSVEGEYSSPSISGTIDVSEFITLANQTGNSYLLENLTFGSNSVSFNTATILDFTHVNDSEYFDFSEFGNDPYSNWTFNIASNELYSSVRLFPSSAKGGYINNFRLRANNSDLIYYDTNENLNEAFVDLGGTNLYDVAILDAIGVGQNVLRLSQNGNTGLVYFTLQGPPQGTSGVVNLDINSVDREFQKELIEGVDYTITINDTDAMWGSSFTLTALSELYPMDQVALPFDVDNSTENDILIHTIKNGLAGEELCTHIRYFERNYTERTCVENIQDSKLVKNFTTSDFTYNNVNIFSDSYSLVNEEDIVYPYTVSPEPDTIYDGDLVYLSDFYVQTVTGNNGVICDYTFVHPDGSEQRLTVSSYNYDYPQTIIDHHLKPDDIHKGIVKIKEVKNLHPYKTSMGACNYKQIFIPTFTQPGNIFSTSFVLDENVKYFLIDPPVLAGEQNLQYYMVHNGTRHDFVGRYLYTGFNKGDSLQLGIDFTPMSNNRSPLILSTQSIGLYSTSLSNNFDLPSYIPQGTSKTYEIKGSKIVDASEKELVMIAEPDDVPRSVHMWPKMVEGEWVENLRILGDRTDPDYSLEEGKSFIYGHFFELDEDVQTDQFIDYIEPGMNLFEIQSTNQKGAFDIFFEGIVNRPPVCLNSVVLSNDLTCTPCTPQDPDGMPISAIEYAWYKNGIPMLNQSNIALTGNVTFASGDIVQCGMRMRDDLVWSIWYESNQVVISSNTTGNVTIGGDYGMNTTIWVWNTSDSLIFDLEDELPYVPFCFMIGAEQFCIDEFGIVRNNASQILPYSFMKDKELIFRFLVMGDYLVFEDSTMVNGTQGVFLIPSTQTWSGVELTGIWDSGNFYVLSESTCSSSGAVDGLGRVCVEVNGVKVWLTPNQHLVSNTEYEYSVIVTQENSSSSPVIEKYRNIFAK